MPLFMIETENLFYPLRYGARLFDMTQPEAGTQIRRFQNADREAVMALAPRLTEGVAPWRDSDAVLATARKWVADSAGNAGTDDHIFYVATSGDEVIGLVSAWERPHFTGQLDTYVGELVVAPSWERHGVARQLMQAAETWAVSRGRPFITLETGAANTPARACYAALGFAEEDVRLTKPVPPPH
jgi:ribosomal protein S18 acetylase RimI-like enzyme